MDELPEGYLERLVEELATRGLIAQVVKARSGPAFCRIVNPVASSLSERVTCAPGSGNPDLYYWWSWGERMHRAEDPCGAATKVARVLEARV